MGKVVGSGRWNYIPHRTEEIKPTKNQKLCEEFVVCRKIFVTLHTKCVV